VRQQLQTSLWTTLAVLAAAGLGACSSSTERSILDSSTTGSAPQQSTWSKFMSSFGAATPSGSASAAMPSEEASSIECPVTDVRPGASTLSVTSARDAAAMDLRYQGTISQMARECQVAGQTVTIKTGVQGRIILGPAGGPGTVELPLRYALVKEGPEPQTIWTKLYMVPVTIAEGQGSMPFVHIEQEMTVAKPKSGDLSDHVIYVGFDPLAAAMQKKPAPKKPAPPKLRR
jgi:hypothetical protein